MDGLPDGVIGHLEAAIDILSDAVAGAKKKDGKKRQTESGGILNIS